MNFTNLMSYNRGIMINIMSFIGKEPIFSKKIDRIIRWKVFTKCDWLYMCDDVEIGRGGCMSPDSVVKIGKHVGIFENNKTSLLNCSVFST